MANSSELIEVKRSGSKALAGIEAAALALKPHEQSRGRVLTRDFAFDVLKKDQAPPLHHVDRLSLAVWLYGQRSDALGTLQLG